MAQDILSRLKVIIGADNTKFLSSIQQSQQRMVGFQKAVSSFAKVASGLFAAGVISRGIQKVVELADIQLKAEAKLLTALKGRSSIQQRLIDQAKDLQKITLFGDEETINAQALLASMGLQENAISRLIPLVQDLAVKQGTDLRSAADLVAKSVGSSTNALSRYGITIEGNVGSTERLESAITELNRVAGGQAAAAANAGTGALTQLSNVISDIGEEIGNVLLPGLNGVATFLKDLDLDQAISDLGTVAGKIKTVGTNLADLLPDVNLPGNLRFRLPILNQLDTARRLLALLAKETKEFQSQSTSGGLGTFDASITGGAGGLPFLGITNKKIISDLQASRQKLSFFDVFEISTSVPEVNQELNKALEDIASQYSLGNSRTITPTEKEINAFALNQGVVQETAEVFREVQKEITNTINLTGTLTSAFNGLFNSIIQGGQSAEDILKGLASTLLGGLFSAFTGGLFGGVGGLFASSGSSIPLARVTGDQLTFVQSRNSQRNSRIGT